jgi:hypothetical protein
MIWNPRNKGKHKSRKGYFCGCVMCEQDRADRVVPGVLCKPASVDPKISSPGTVPAWPINCWKRTGWLFRLESNGIRLLTVIGSIKQDDDENGGHLGCVVVMTHEPRHRILVTSKKWLVAL